MLSDDKITISLTTPLHGVLSLSEALRISSDLEQILKMPVEDNINLQHIKLKLNDYAELEGYKILNFSKNKYGQNDKIETQTILLDELKNKGFNSVQRLQRMGVAPFCYGISIEESFKFSENINILSMIEPASKRGKERSILVQQFAGNIEYEVQDNTNLRKGYWAQMKFSLVEMNNIKQNKYYEFKWKHYRD